jgi:hypothetical protein
MMRDRRAKFIELANKRVNRTIKDIRLIGNLSNRSAYEFSEEDAKRIARVLQKELDTLKNRFGGQASEEDEPFKITN